VTKKIEKKISEAPVSTVTDAMIAPFNNAAGRGALEADAKTAAVGKAAKAPAPAATMPAAIETAASAAKQSAAEIAPTPAIEAKPAEKLVAPVGKPAKAGAPPRQGFRPHEFIVYPAHGVGQIVAIEEQEVAGFKLELFVISFIKDKMILKVPTPKVASVGMRKLADADVVKRALDTLTGRARVKRTMWSRRAQEYEAKINSGDLISIAEVVRDLYRSDAQPEQSYSERQLYEAALDRMAREIVVVQKLTETESLKAIEAQLQKGPRRGSKADEIEAEEAEIEEAA
jgi:CarD family transcriptional regulator